MQQRSVYEYLNKNADFLLPNDKYPHEVIVNAMLSVPDSVLYTLDAIPFRKPATVKKIAIFPGILGIDRFYLGDIKGGILKYFTFGGVFVWWIKDIKSAENRCREYNCRKLIEALNDPSAIDGMRKVDNIIEQGKKAAPIVRDIGSSIAKGASNVSSTFDVKMKK